MSAVRPRREDFLSAMARASRARANELATRLSPQALRARIRALPPARGLALSHQGFDLIAEVKFASPSSGRLGEGPSASRAAERARRYAAAGACAISVLTEPARFSGSLAHLRAAAAASSVPVMRKDFLVHPIQVLQARAAGADGVLLVLRLVEDEELAALLETCRETGLFALLEAFDERDLERAQRVLETFRAVSLLVGVNARDLATLRVDPARHLRLAPLLPRGAPAVAESGIETAGDARAAAEAGYSLALVGSSLMRAQDPACLVRDLLEAGRAARAEASER